MKVLRTPDAAFADLCGYEFAPYYTTIPDGAGGHTAHASCRRRPVGCGPILCLHGEPTWSYLYRKMIPVFAKAGHRVLAPDLVGFGTSDKSAERGDYTYQDHIDWVTSWLIGLRLIAAMPERTACVVAANTALPTGDEGPWPAFEAWRGFSQSVEQFNSGRIVYGATTRRLSDQNIAACNAPFPDERYKAGARQFPMLVPTRPDDPASEPNRASWQVLRGLDLPLAHYLRRGRQGDGGR
ncbi:alpha/beta fold hydrolase [Tateyamaria pelophila]|uniref:alpha/beta fold hydrolase n=1 Tax=Tateyamaria pelophila TaxID=328415 RepID=UPI001CBA951C|nr:alpha/beta fold hydrolase [Tateyamaria pelophila]